MAVVSERQVEIDIPEPWRLSHVLEGHTSDVKALSTLDTQHNKDWPAFEVFQSASRDEQARTWQRPVPSRREGNVPPSKWLRGAVLDGKRFQNSVTMLELGTEDGFGMSVIGGLDAQIRIYHLHYLPGSQTPASSEPAQVLQDHHDNVCHLSVSSERTPQGAPYLLISASWDCTSRIWRLHQDQKAGPMWKPLHLLKGHESAVWAAEVVSAKVGEERYLTASADLFVRYWHGEELKRIFSGHVDVVRGIALLPARVQEADSELSGHQQSTEPHYFNGEELFATCSNDGTVRIWSLDDRRCPPNNPTSGGDALHTLTPEQDGSPLLDLVYDVRYAGTDSKQHDRLLLSCGEGGKVHIWNADKAKHVTHIPQPVTSTWNVLFLPLSGDIATADSDGMVRVYTQRFYNTALMAQEARLEDRQRGALAEWDAAMVDEHNQACERVAQGHRTQVRADIVAREGGGISQDEENTHDGQCYDAILKVDVSDDTDPLSLPINKGDDPIAKAKAFIAEHKLSEHYEDDIVAFIKQVGPG